MIEFEQGMIVKNRLDGRKMILIASDLQIECGDLHCRYFNEVTGMYEDDLFSPEELAEWKE